MLFLTPEQVAKLAEAIDPDYRLHVLMAVYSRLRWGELVGLRRDRVSVLVRTRQVVEQLTEVGGKLSFGPPKTSAGRFGVRDGRRLGPRPAVWWTSR
jgi:integrase